MRRISRAILLGAALVATGCAATLNTGARGQTAAAPASSAAAASIDALLAGIYGPDKPGATVIVVKDGRVLFRKAYGLANVELRVPMQPESVLALASLSKQFTAAAILKLSEAGRLSVRDDITGILPAYPTHGQNVTIEHLLTHTSGLNALSETSDLRAVSAQEGKLIDVLGDWAKDLPPDSAPGERWAYSDWGYNLLGAIIEKVSGQSYAAYLRQQIFEPLGMQHTYYSDRRQIIPLRATGYDAPADAVFNVLPTRSRIFQPSGAGGLLSTVDDLARWNDALSGDRLLASASRAKMFTPFRLNDGTSTGYGYGWDIGSDDGHVVQEHAGGTTGFVSHMVRMPDDRVFVVVLSNRVSMTPPIQATAHRVAAIAAGRPIADPVAVPVSVADLDALTGTFRGTDVGTVTVSCTDGALQAQIAGFPTMALVPVAPLTFRTRLVTWTFSFVRGADGGASQVRVRDWKLNDVAVRVSLPLVTPPSFVALDRRQLDAVSGEYESLNGVIVRIEHVDDHLVATPTAQPGVPLFPISAVEFWTTDGSLRYTFVRNVRGEVAGYLRVAGGATPVPARRLGLTTNRLNPLDLTLDRR